MTRDQWLIYGDEELEGVVRALETEALAVLGEYLIRTGDFDRKRIGGILVKIANSRRQINLGHTPQEEKDGTRHMMEAVIRMLNVPDDAEAVDKVHAALSYIDRRIGDAGTTGPGFIREIVRGD